jgi:hypothetical protein
MFFVCFGIDRDDRHEFLCSSSFLILLLAWFSAHLLDLARYPICGTVKGIDISAER